MSISIVIPAYNAATTIAKALKSCNLQTYRPLEIIVVLDACSDDTEKILKEDFPEVKRINLPQNTGVSNVRNAGMKAAKGDWVAFLDADDEWHPDKLKILHYYINHTEAAKLFLHSFTIDDLASYELPPVRTVKKVKFGRLLLKNEAQGSCICLKRAENIFFNEDFRYCEDHELALRQSWQDSSSYFIPYSLTKLGRPVLSEGGLSGSHWAMRQGEIKMYARLWRLDFFLLPLIPFLILFSLLKHLRKKSE